MRNQIYKNKIIFNNFNCVSRSFLDLLVKFVPGLSLIPIVKTLYLSWVWGHVAGRSGVQHPLHRVYKARMAAYLLS